MQNQYYWALTDDYIAHHGILGQKWGVRRFQDKNGRLTDEGKRRIQAGDSKAIKDIAKERTNNMYKNMSEADLNKRKEAFKDDEEKHQKFINAPDNTSKEDRKKLHNDSDKSSQKLSKLREDDIKKFLAI